jgi:hypothetical protein
VPVPVIHCLANEGHRAVGLELDSDTGLDRRVHAGAVLACNHLAISYVSLAGIGAPFGELSTPLLAPDFSYRPATADRHRDSSLEVTALIFTLRAGR